MQIMHAVLHTNMEPVSVAASLREALRPIDPDLPVAKLTTVAALVDESLAGQRFATLLLVGALAMLLASIGMYGVISYAVTQRTREIGIRMALGAGRGKVFGMVIGEGALLAGLGIFVGLTGALAVTKLMASALFGVVPHDFLTFSVVSLLLGVVALLACYVPARRAMQVDPMIALRYE